jgi:hydroxymethylbilane synthase
MSTGGDKNQSQPLHLIGTTSTAGKSLWTEELEVALLKGQVDIIVHSLKDIPTVLKDGCEIGAILEREDPRDCLVVRSGLSWRTLEELPEGSVVGTSSVRRVAQLKRAYPKLKFADVVRRFCFIIFRGNAEKLFTTAWKSVRRLSLEYIATVPNSFDLTETPASQN